jgi:hypothetical protein
MTGPAALHEHQRTQLIATAEAQYRDYPHLHCWADWQLVRVTRGSYRGGKAYFTKGEVAIAGPPDAEGNRPVYSPTVMVAATMRPDQLEIL